MEFGPESLLQRRIREERSSPKYSVFDPSSDTHFPKYCYKRLSLDDIERMKKEFREKNKTDLIIAKGGVDHAYNKYCAELDAIINESLRYS